MDPCFCILRASPSVACKAIKNQKKSTFMQVKYFNRKMHRCIWPITQLPLRLAYPSIVICRILPKIAIASSRGDFPGSISRSMLPDQPSAKDTLQGLATPSRTSGGLLRPSGSPQYAVKGARTRGMNGYADCSTRDNRLPVDRRVRVHPAFSRRVRHRLESWKRMGNYSKFWKTTFILQYLHLNLL